MSGISHEVRSLDNGAQLCFVDVPYSKMLQVGVEFSCAGDRYSPPEGLETAHLAEHMVLAGADAEVGGQSLRSSRDFRLGVESNGAQVIATTYAEEMHYKLQSPLRGSGRAVDCFMAAIERPLFDPAELPSERKIVRDELVGYLDDERRVLLNALRRSIGQPEADIQVAISQLDSITSDDLREHHARTHRTQGMLAVVTGPLARIDAAAMTSRFERIRLGAAAPEKKPAPALSQPEQPVLIEWPRQGIHYTLRRFGIHRHTPELNAVGELVKGALFQAADAFIYERVRDSGLAYNIAGNLEHDRHGTEMFGVVGETAPEKAPALWRFVCRQIEGLLAGITEKEFDGIRQHKLGQLELRHETPVAVHTTAFHALRRFGKPETPDELIARVGSVTYDQFRANVRAVFAGGVGVAGATGAGLERQPEIVAALQEAQEFFASLGPS